MMIKQIGMEILAEWNRVEATRLGAALAFYSMLSIAPLLVVAIAVAGAILGESAVRGELSHQMQELIGAKGAAAIEELISSSARQNTEGLFASALSFLMLLWAAGSVVSELRSSLNKIWGRDGEDTFKGFVLGRTYALALVLGAGFLLLLSLLASAVLAALSKHLSVAVGGLTPVLELWNFVSSLVLGTILFALIIRGIPGVDVSWRDTMPGAFLTAVLFTFGKYLIGLYLGRAGIDSTYGAAGSLVIFLLWVYYASQILYLGAIVTKIWVQHHAPRPVLVAG